jgi:hypothetical protein
MNYDDAKRMFAGRRKNAVFKRAFNYYRLVEVPEGLQFQYEDKKNSPIATVSPESVWTMHLDIQARDVHSKLVLRKIIGREISISNDSKSLFKNQLRFYAWCVELCGYKPGLQYDSINRKVLNAEPDKKRIVDKEAYKQHKPVLDVTKHLTTALMRLGAVDIGARTSWFVKKDYNAALQAIRDHIDDGGSVDENYDFSSLIELALQLAAYAVGSPEQLVWVGNQYKKLIVLDWQKQVIGRAQAKIRKDLKHLLGVYEYVTEQKGN